MSNIPKPATLETLLNGSFSATSHGIAALAETLAIWKSLSIEMGDAKDIAQEKADEIPMAERSAEDSPYTRAIRVGHRFERIANSAWAKADLLERLIGELEPQTLDEVLSMVLVFTDALEGFAGDHANVGSDENSCRDLRGLQRSLAATVRGLLAAGASSPLVDFYITRDNQETWAEALRIAQRAAVEPAP